MAYLFCFKCSGLRKSVLYETSVVKAEIVSDALFVTKVKTDIPTYIVAGLVRYTLLTMKTITSWYQPAPEI